MPRVALHVDAMAMQSATPRLRRLGTRIDCRGLPRSRIPPYNVTMVSDRLPPRFPKFDNVEDARRHRKHPLSAAFRLFGHFGFNEGVAGHITARDPELLDHFWVNPLGMNFKQIRVKDLILVNDHGEVVDGNWPVNTAAFVIHSQVHA